MREICMLMFIMLRFERETVRVCIKNQYNLLKFSTDIMLSDSLIDTRKIKGIDDVL